MTQRIITGCILSAAVIIILCFGGVAVGLAAMLCICFAVHEEYKALSVAGHRPVAWPTWLALVLSVPLTAWLGERVIVVILAVSCLLTMTHIIFRPQPRLEDALMSVLPLFSVLLPGLCIVFLAFVQPMELQRVLLFLVITVPVLGDTMAYFVGSAIRGPKFCPAVSPNKTIAGALGGLGGSLLAAIVVGLVAHSLCGPEIAAKLPHWWTYLIVGLLGGAASQVGDLFASLVKRHCGIKDFSNLFPGHGGMLDRLDSILFMAVVVFCVRMMGMGL